MRRGWFWEKLLWLCYEIMGFSSHSLKIKIKTKTKKRINIIFKNQLNKSSLIYKNQKIPKTNKQTRLQRAQSHNQTSRIKKGRGQNGHTIIKY